MTAKVSAKIWVCKYGCPYVYRSTIPISANAHFCPKRKGEHVESIPQKEVPEIACVSDDDPVPSLTPQAPTSKEDTDMATTRAEPKESATKPKLKAVPKEATVEKKGRRSMGGRGWLATKVEAYLRTRPTETVSVGEIVKSIKNVEGEHPSTGAVAAVILRWGEAGYIKVKNERPLSFNGYTAKWKESSLDAFLEFEKTRRAKAKAAAKA